MQGLGVALADALVKDAAKKSKAADKVPAGYSSIGVFEVGPVELQGHLIRVALKNTHAPEDWRHFGKHALPVASARFVELTHKLMNDEDIGSNHDSETAPNIHQHFIPYLTMFSKLCIRLWLATSLHAPSVHLKLL